MTIFSDFLCGSLPAKPKLYAKAGDAVTVGHPACHVEAASEDGWLSVTNPPLPALRP